MHRLRLLSTTSSRVPAAVRGNFLKSRHKLTPQRRRFLSTSEVASASPPEVRLKLAVDLYRAGSGQGVNLASHQFFAITEFLLRSIAALPELHMSASGPSTVSAFQSHGSWYIATYHTLPGDFEGLVAIAPRLFGQDMPAKEFVEYMRPTRAMRGEALLHLLHSRITTTNKAVKRANGVLFGYNGVAMGLHINQAVVEGSIVWMRLEQLLEAQRQRRAGQAVVPSTLHNLTDYDTCVTSLREFLVAPGADVVITTGSSQGQAQRKVFRPVFTSLASKSLFEGFKEHEAEVAGVRFLSLAADVLTAGSGVDGGIVINPVGDLNHELAFKAATVVGVEELRVLVQEDAAL